MVTWIRDFARWFWYYRWRIWHYVWRAGFFILCIVAIQLKWLTTFQMLCLAGIFFFIGYMLIHWKDDDND